jgi:hypothetical protein
MNGLLHYIGTGGNQYDFVNPHETGEVVAKMSSIMADSELDPGSKFRGIPLSRDPAILVQHPNDGRTMNWTDNEKSSWAWVSVDLGEGRSLVPNYYRLNAGADCHFFCPTSWNLEGSNDDINWTVLRAHKNDQSLSDVAKLAEVAIGSYMRSSGSDWRGSMQMASWEVEGANQAYRHFRIRLTKEVSSGARVLCIAGIELWGQFLNDANTSSIPPMRILSRIMKNGGQ